MVIGGVSKNLKGHQIIEAKTKARPRKKYGINDQIQLAIIGYGIQGMINARMAVKIDGINIRAACDLYSGRLERMKEMHGEDIFVTNDYPETISSAAFNVQMRVNFADGSGGGSHIRLIGNEGVLTIKRIGIHISKSKIDTVPTYKVYDSFPTFSKAQQEDFKKWYHSHYDEAEPEMMEPQEYEYTTPKGYSAHVDHWQNFADAIRHGTELVEDGTFELRAAGPSLATNNSYFETRVINWDAKNMKIV